ncbi:MAG: tannase/feruloyl esterase family alpha/beta hydrolase, partial [Caulobacter sp.]
VIRARPGSRIGFEVWLPERWNGRLLMLGNGGYSAALPYPAMKAYLAAGYAVTATDTGHAGDDPAFARDAPGAIDDWARRAAHLTAQSAKRAIRLYYGRPQSFAYFQGCSTGGHQAFMETQRYPDDFDGVVAGAPGHNRTRLNAGFAWQFVQNHDETGRLIIPASKLALVRRSALAQCRAAGSPNAGGLSSDPYLDAPWTCAPDPTVLRCVGDDSDDCLTDRQIRALRRMYDGARNPRTGERIYFGWPPGSESPAGPFGGWSAYWADPARPGQMARADFWRYWAGFGPAWNGARFDFDAAFARADARLAPRINAMSPDLDAFRRRGGKLIHWHGGADPVVPVQDSIVYRQRVVDREAAAGRDADSFYRLFVAPGVEHCQGGLGPAPVALQSAIEAWVEEGRAPASLLAVQTRGGVEGKGFSRPLCPYPAVARYAGQGPRDGAESFACIAPARATRIEPPAPRYLR